MSWKRLNSALISVGVLSLVGVVMVFAYMKQVNIQAAVPSSYEEAVIQRIRAEQAQPDPMVTFIPEGLRGTDEVPEVNTTDPIYGNPDAGVSIIGFVDLECPSCKDLDEQIRKRVDKSNGTLRFIWKDFPIPRIHKNSQDAAEAARCAQQQGKFWEYTQDLFNNQLTLGEAVYIASAEEENLDLAAFVNCRAGDEMLSLIQRDYLTGRSFQVEETPTLYVGGRRLKGLVTEDELDKALDQAFGR